MSELKSKNPREHLCILLFLCWALVFVTAYSKREVSQLQPRAVPHAKVKTKLSRIWGELVLGSQNNASDKTNLLLLLLCYAAGPRLV